MIDKGKLKMLAKFSDQTVMFGKFGNEGFTITSCAFYEIVNIFTSRAYSDLVRATNLDLNVIHCPTWSENAPSWF